MSEKTDPFLRLQMQRVAKAIRAERELMAYVNSGAQADTILDHEIKRIAKATKGHFNSCDPEDDTGHPGHPSNHG